MRYLHALTVAAVLLAGLTGAQAEKKIFILNNDSDGYGIDRCLATGASCGRAMATAICKAREFSQAVSYRKIDRDDITGAVPDTGAACRGAACDDFVAIECTR